MHLTSGELVDIAEGARSETSAPHLAACESCRAQLVDLREMMAAARDVDVPEPSPLFWDHLSSRVSEAVADDARLKPSRYVFGWISAALWRRGVQDPMLAVGVVGLLVAAILSSRVNAPGPLATPPSMVVVAPAASPELLGDLAPDEDASLTLVSALLDGADADAMREAGLAPRGSAEHAITHMSDGELRELQRLLKEELARPGA